MPDENHMSTLFGVLESLSEPTVFYNESLRIHWMNPAAEIFFGVSLERAHGMSCIDILPYDLPCRSMCPVRKAFTMWETVSLLTEGLSSGERLLTAVPLMQDEETKLVVEVIQGAFMEVPKAPFLLRVLERVNSSFDLQEAAPALADAVREVAGPVAAGVYGFDGAGYPLVHGVGVPDSMNRVPILPMISRSPLYVRTSCVFTTAAENVPEEVSILPFCSDGSPDGLLLCGSIPDSSSRERLEELQQLMNGSITRFLQAEQYRRQKG